MRATSVISTPIQRPSPSDHRVGSSNLVNEANTDSLALRPAISPLQNLQHPITQMLLCGATEMNGKFLGQDFNLLDRLPVTAYDLTPFERLK